MRIGIGFDLHRLRRGRPLLLGGVRIPHPSGLVGHSDGDVILHALIDALLGAAGLGDIGEHFSDTDPAWKGASSEHLLAGVLEKLKGWRVVNVDLTLLAEEPKIHPYREPIRKKVAGILKVSQDQVNVKAKTMEGLGMMGAKEAMAAMAVCQLERKSA